MCVSASAVNVFAGDGDDVVDASRLGVKGPMSIWVLVSTATSGDLANNTVSADGTDDTVTDAGWAYLTVAAPVTGAPGTYTGGGIAVWSTDQDVEIDLDTDMVTVGGAMRSTCLASSTRA